VTIQRNVAEAKTQLSQLLNAAMNGEEVVIARAGRAIVRLVPVEPVGTRRLGSMPLEVPDELFDPLTDDELADWS
jgi:prevent-host-death family protein